MEKRVFGRQRLSRKDPKDDIQRASRKSKLQTCVHLGWTRLRATAEGALINQKPFVSARTFGEGTGGLAPPCGRRRSSVDTGAAAHLVGDNRR